MQKTQFSLELAGLAEDEFFGMSNDLSIHAPSVPVQPVATYDTGAATTKVRTILLRSLSE